MEQQVMNFDPVTGQPLTPEAMQMRGAQPAQEPPKKKNTALIITLACIGGVIILAIAGVLAFNLFASKRSQIAKATKNTFKNYAAGENLLATSLNPQKIITSPEYTHTAEIDIRSGNDVTKLNMDIIKAKKALQVSGDAQFSSSYINMPSVEYYLQMDDRQVRAYSPFLNYVFVYNYKKENSGYLATMLQGMGVPQENLNKSLSDFYDAVFKNAKNTGEYEDLLKAFDASAKVIKYSRGKAQKFLINGKEHRCRAIKAEVTKEFFDTLTDELNKYFEKYYGDVMDEAGFSASDMTSELKNVLGEDETMEITFYIYRNALAAIDIIYDGDDTEIFFEGGEYRAQNIRVESNESEILLVRSTKEKGKEAFSLELEGTEYIHYTYDSKEGTLEMTLSDGWNDYKMNDVSIRRKAGELDIDASVNANSGETIDVTYQLKKGAKIDELFAEQFDLGAASEDDFNDLVNEIQKVILEILGY